MWSWALLWLGLFPTISLVANPLVPGTLAPNKAQEQSQLPLCRCVSALRTLRLRTQPPKLSTGAPVLEEGRGKGNRDLVLGGETNGFTRTTKKRGVGWGQLMFLFFFFFVWGGEKLHVLDRSFWQFLLNIIIAWKEQNVTHTWANKDSFLPPARSFVSCCSWRIRPLRCFKRKWCISRCRRHGGKWMQVIRVKEGIHAASCWKLSWGCWMLDLKLIRQNLLIQKKIGVSRSRHFGLLIRFL